MRVGRFLSLTAILCLALVVATPGCGSRHRTLGRRVIVLGFDGLDFNLTRDLMARGRLPHFAQLAAHGMFAPLGTSIPPQSPVAWSSFITGLDPGEHGIFDFVHRDPKAMTPFLSTTRTEPPKHVISFGKWRFPLAGGRVELLRQGEPFWHAVEQHGIETTIIRMPANFPPSGSATRELSGMGTPDLLGTYGTFSFYTSDPFATEAPVPGGAVYVVDIADGAVRATLQGPPNPLVDPPENVRAPFVAHLDPSHTYAKLVVGAEERLLRVGEWSDWVPVRFPLTLGGLRAQCRFYLKQLAPSFELYVSPLNLDPLAPALPISTPGAYAADLARATGRFYTQGMPEDTSGLKAGVLTRAEFLQQARIAAGESERQYDYVLGRFTDGLLFYYFGHVDQVSHMMWRPMDPQHPAYDPADDPRYASVVEDLYVEMDGIVGRTASRLASGDLLVVMSDHGFVSWRRAFNLNSWLRDNGYLALRQGRRTGGAASFEDIDWSATRAYGLGLNGLYLNLRGRESTGIVDPGSREALAAEIGGKLLGTVDPASGEPAVTKVFRSEQIYRPIGNTNIAPDIIVGYARGTRVSDESALGGVPAAVIVDNRSMWTGDHCMDPDVVPGILLTSRRLRTPAPHLKDLAAAILADIGIDRFPSGNKGAKIDVRILDQAR
jgi:predicted AlkP superfamily phosphohydrolase/phosphomutase